MAQSGRFGLSVRVLGVLASDAGAMHSSTAIAEELGESAVMVRRTFLLLQRAGLISQRKGPNGGAKLKVAAKEIGMGDVYAASEDSWLTLGDDRMATVEKKLRKEAVTAMNVMTLAQVVKRAARG